MCLDLAIAIEGEESWVLYREFQYRKDHITIWPELRKIRNGKGATRAIPVKSNSMDRDPSCTE